MLYFINHDIFTLDLLNQRIKRLSYDTDQCANIPAPITEKNLKKSKKFKMTAAETFNFAHNLPFILGDLVAHLDDEG